VIQVTQVTHVLISPHRARQCEAGFWGKSRTLASLEGAQPWAHGSARRTRSPPAPGELSAHSRSSDLRRHGWRLRLPRHPTSTRTRSPSAGLDRAFWQQEGPRSIGMASVPGDGRYVSARTRRPERLLTSNDTIIHDLCSHVKRKCSSIALAGPVGLDRFDRLTDVPQNFPIARVRADGVILGEVVQSSVNRSNRSRSGRRLPWTTPWPSSLWPPRPCRGIDRRPPNPMWRRGLMGDTPAGRGAPNRPGSAGGRQPPSPSP